MRAREWEHVLRALLQLKCQVAKQTDANIVIVRGAVKRHVFRKAPMSIDGQRLLIRVLEFDEAEWAEALRATS